MVMGVSKSLFNRPVNLPFSGRTVTRETLYLIYFLLAVLILAYIIPTLIFRSSSGTDVYTHMYSTLRMVGSNSLFEFYEKSFIEEQLLYDYPFGLWFFGSIVMKVTGMGIQELAYILPLILLVVSISVYYIYARSLLLSTNKAILACIFLLSMPVITMGMLNYSTGRFVAVFLVASIYLSINKPRFSNVLIAGLLVFSLGFTHTGTYMFLMFFSISYFILSAMIWKKFDTGMYILIVSLLVLYVISVQLFPFVQPQYIDKGRMILSISQSLSSKLGLEYIREMGQIFYDRIFVANNFIYVIFWSCLIFVIGRSILFIRSRIGSIDNINPLAIPVIGSINNVSHSIVTTPFWLGPVHTLLSIFGVFKLDQKGKCIAFSLVLTSLFPGALQSEEGTGSLRQIYFLFLIIPISSAAGFYYIIPAINKYSNNKIKKSFAAIFVLLLFLPLIFAPIIGNLYYQPTITGTRSEIDNLMWLSTVGNSTEGVPGFAYRERIDLYANKLTPSVRSGSETKRYLNNLKNVYFSEGAEGYIKDLRSFNINYIISSQRILKGFNEYNTSLSVDSNKQLDKIYASDANFGIYKYIAPPAPIKNSNPQRSGLRFEDNAPEIKNSGSAYLIENEFYKVKLSDASPRMMYIGTMTKNFLGEGGLYDTIAISWRGAYKDKYAYYDLGDLKYPYISVDNNEITYRTAIRDESNTENWATLIVRYIFYEKAVQRDITVANDWVNLNDYLSMYVTLSSTVFAPLSDFEFNQVGYKEENPVYKKIYPSQDTVVLKDKKINQIYLNESGTGLFIKYSDLNPYPTRMLYRGSTVYQYASVSMDSRYSLSPAGSADITQYFSVGDKPTATNNMLYYTSVSPYLYSDARIPVILIGYLNQYSNAEYSSNIYGKLQDYNLIYNEVIRSGDKTSFQNGINHIGYADLFDKSVYKSQSDQDDEIKKVKALGVNGMTFRGSKYNMDTIKVLSDNNVLFTQALTVNPPFMEFYREGLRHPKAAYYQGEKTGVVLIPVTLPVSAVLRPESNIDDTFSSWRETLDSVADDGGMAVFWWNAADIGNPDYLDEVVELIEYSKSRGMSFTTPDIEASHFRSLNRVYTKATRGVDYAILNISNYNMEDVTGITYRLQLPALNDSCPYYAVNGRISRQEMKYGDCMLYVSTDLMGNEHKQVTIEPDYTRKEFDLDFSGIYEGNAIITVRDSEGAPVDDASIYVDGRNVKSNPEGEVEVLIRRGVHRIRAEKPGFISKDYEIVVKGRVYKIAGLLR